MPGVNRYGLEHADQPVLAVGEVRYQGEPVALVAADHPETARRALKRIVVDYEVLDAGHRRRSGASRAEGAVRCTRAGTCVRHVPIRVRPQRRRPEPTWWSAGEYEVGMQDQAFLGPESGLAVPRRGRRRRPVRRHAVAARRPAADRRGARACRPTRCG